MPKISQYPTRVPVSGDLEVLAIGGKNYSADVNKVGRVIQIVNTQTGATATGSTTIPFDDTIPQGGEGDQYMSLAITPTNANNILYVDVTFIGVLSAAVTMIVALFQDLGVNALAAAFQIVPGANFSLTITFRHKMTAGTTSATTFKVRSGPSSAATLTFNGNASGRRLGGVAASSITITEVRA
ncbi:MAG: hypothetical protein EHM33_01935 [Chloroflexi bacterium]|nr:MAG: hypothetical protein EHM33_01935 [Chloroflexota bacterium]